MADNMRSIQQHSGEALLNLESAYAEMVADITDTTFASHRHQVELAPQPNIRALATTTWRGHTVNTEPLKPVSTLRQPRVTKALRYRAKQVAKRFNAIGGVYDYPDTSMSVTARPMRTS